MNAVTFGFKQFLYSNTDLSSCPSRIQQLQHVRVYTDACLLFVEHTVSWDDARKSCRSFGGDLVMIKDSAKQKFILDSLTFEHWNTQNIWIGATDKAKEGDWRWIDGSHVTYGNFADGQGNKYHATRRFLFSDGSNEDCALIRRSDGGLWHDYPCDFGLGSLGYHYTYVCEFRKTDKLVQVGSTTTFIPQNTNPYNTTITTVSTQSTTAKAFILTKLVKTGRNVTFSCPITRVDGIIEWYGPPDSRTLYASGTVTNPRLSTIAIVGDHALGEYNLYLSFVTKYDEGHYTCSMTYNDLSACPTRIRTLKHVRVYTDACVLFVEHELSWDDARKSCRSLGGDLVTVKDSGKEKFILDSLRLEHWNAANVWIGLTDRAKEGDWRWIDGSHVAYGHFAKGQGNNHNTGFLFAGGSNWKAVLDKT
ncbi:Hypothetical predicted protein [Mytilus galloprovincialis]|uniref:C-type lectin domain-containing protein n=1 Tax=Mytilus galloprovincialis TaxID=29158 RepID=A0A8B6DRQ2_MYTGA|nr:Hypothetical predicted protein [Mytilus galloprovincialis]